MEADLCRHGTRRYVVRAAEGGEEVVECVFVGDVDGGEAEAPLVAVTLEEVFLTDRGVEEATRVDALWVFVVISSVGSRNADQAGGELRCEAGAGQGDKRSRLHAVASQASLKLLISV